MTKVTTYYIIITNVSWPIHVWHTVNCCTSLKHCCIHSASVYIASACSDDLLLIWYVQCQFAYMCSLTAASCSLLCLSAYSVITLCHCASHGSHHLLWLEVVWSTSRTHWLSSLQWTDTFNNFYCVLLFVKWLSRTSIGSWLTSELWPTHVHMCL